ncbi:HNH endonuclease [Acinetobacter sp. ABJ_C3_5]|uniref:HNH endonuclease n=1 Tax=Acinetobacter courvalinii TaxID=280147 RepID=UPI0037C9E36E
MIKLQRSEKPEFLTDEKVKELTDKFKANNNDDVWKQDCIHKALLLSSASKCAYCEIKVQVKSTYMEIEHFKDKSHFPDDVVEWLNLLPSCKRCNTTKSTHNVVTNPIINPFDIDPKDHLTQSAFRLYFKTDLGEETRDTLNLNDTKLTKPRAAVWDYVVDKIEELHRDIIPKQKITKHDRNKLSRLMVSCQADQAFSAFSATALHQSNEYLEIIAALKRSNQWDEQMEILHRESLRLVLDKR